jgi:hypothetical protein
LAAQTGDRGINGLGNARSRAKWSPQNFDNISSVSLVPPPSSLGGQTPAPVDNIQQSTGWNFDIPNKIEVAEEKGKSKNKGRYKKKRAQNKVKYSIGEFLTQAEPENRPPEVKTLVE